jgi:hypothetical protein
MLARNTNLALDEKPAGFYLPSQKSQTFFGQVMTKGKNYKWKGKKPEVQIQVVSLFKIRSGRKKPELQIQLTLFLYAKGRKRYFT